MRAKRFLMIALCACVAWGCLGQARPASGTRNSTQPKRPPEQEVADADKTTTAAFGPKRKAPVFTGAFSVGFILIRFQDTKTVDFETLKKRMTTMGETTVTEYLREYSQGITWPEFFFVGGEGNQAAIYQAPHIKGYYCEHDSWGNPAGWPNAGEGNRRADELRKAAHDLAFKHYKRPSGVSLRSDGKPNVLCYIYMDELLPKEEHKAVVRPFYGDRKMPYNHEIEAWTGYNPSVAWGDPLWPNSLVQVFASGGGGTMAHELGHVLGAPDFYHAPEKNDGVDGTPCLGWDYGPTGPAYCRYIYSAFLKDENYPTFTKDGTYALAPRILSPAGTNAVGCFIPSNHPHYMFNLEYVKGEPGKHAGLLISVINTTSPSPYMGPPDLHYTYRAGDPYLQGTGNFKDVLFNHITGRTEFTPTSDIPSRLPNLLDSGVSITKIREIPGDRIAFDLKIDSAKPTPAEYKDSLLPKTLMGDATNVLPTSFRGKMQVIFRGEPLLTEYGICWHTVAKPTTAHNTFPLFHRDRYEAQIPGLKPNTTYFARAYAQSPLGIKYSDNEVTFKTPPAAPLGGTVEPLLNDRFDSNWYVERYHGRAADGNGWHIGSGAPVFLMKLMNYYRAPITGDNPRNIKLDFTRVHTNPSTSRPGFRLSDFDAAFGFCNGLADRARMKQAKWDSKDEREFAKQLGLRSNPGGRDNSLIPVEKATPLAPLIERVKKNLYAESSPVVLVQEYEAQTPSSFCLGFVIIDGYRDGDEFHFCFPQGKNRNFPNFPSGWYTFDALLWKEVNRNFLIFDFSPGKTGTSPAPLESIRR